MHVLMKGFTLQAVAMMTQTSCLRQIIYEPCSGKRGLKGGHLDFSHLTKLK